MSKPAFVCAVWNCPALDFDKWIARGANTLIGCGLVVGDTPEARRDWATSARTKGLWTVYDPQSGPVLDNQLAFLLPDEMDSKEWPAGSGHWNGWPREKIKPLYDAFKVKAPLPVLMSLAGDHVTQANRLAYYQSIADCCDIWMEDGYPRNRNAITYSEQLWPGQALALMKTASPDKPRWAMIETGNQFLKNSPNGRAPSPAEVAQAFQYSKDNGASGVGCFSHFFDPATGGWRGFDNTRPEVAAVITSNFKAFNPPSPAGPTMQQQIDQLRTNVTALNTTVASIITKNVQVGNLLIEAGKILSGQQP